MMSRLDARTRVILALLFSVAVVAEDRLEALVALLGLAIGLAALARLPLKGTARRLVSLEGFMVVVLAMLPFTMPGRPLLEIGGMAASAEGLARAVAIALKANAAAVALLALVGSLDTVELGRALARLGAPERLVHLFLFTVRYLEVPAAEYRRLRIAMKARGFQASTGLHTWRSLGCLFGMLLVRAMERAERIDAAMRCRGFDGRFHLGDEARPGALDWGFATASATAVALVMML
jgi:cobalt/nickel transport system permease protein